MLAVDRGGRSAKASAFTIYLFVFQQMGIMEGYDPNGTDLAVESAVLGYWTRFAGNGDPNGADAARWPAYDAASDPYLFISSTVEARAQLHESRCDFWDEMAATR